MHMVRSKSNGALLKRCEAASGWYKHIAPIEQDIVGHTQVRM